MINDIKLFAQADREKDIDGFATSDSECMKMFSGIKQNIELSFSFYDIKNSCNEVFGFLPLR